MLLPQVMKLPRDFSAEIVVNAATPPSRIRLSFYSNGAQVFYRSGTSDDRFV